MGCSHRKGQTLVETLIVCIFMTMILIFMDHWSEVLKEKYNAYKIQQRHLFKN